MARFPRCVLLIVEYDYTKSGAGDQMPQDLTLRTRLCGTALITQPGCLFLFPPDHNGREEMLCTS